MAFHFKLYAVGLDGNERDVAHGPYLDLTDRDLSCLRVIAGQIAFGIVSRHEELCLVVRNHNREWFFRGLRVTAP